MNFNKIWLIVKREYLSRVKKKSFILLTLLTPFLFLLFFAIVALIFAYEGDETKTIAVLDKSNLFDGVIADRDNIYFQFPDASLEELKKETVAGEYSGILVVPVIDNVKTKTITSMFYADDQLPLTIEEDIKSIIRSKVRDFKMAEMGIDQDQMDYLNTRIRIDPEPISEGVEDKGNYSSFIGAGIGYLMGMIMFFITFFYGTFVMRGVFEEKVNRINELIISSVKPFELMAGKILGIGGVGLTQIAIWSILIPLVSMIGTMFIPMDPNMINTGNAEMVQEMSNEINVMGVINEVSNQNWGMILPVLILYFLGGYLLFSALFAAVGSAMGDDMQEGQTLTLPITLPVILSLYIAMSILRSPNSSLAFWASIFPFFSPIVMPARLAFDPPTWQIVLSLVLLYGCAGFCIWLAGRIYRVGILMYGKKATFKELAKWMFYKG